MAADSSDIDAAIVALLAEDSTLMALVPDGVYVDQAPPGMTRFVIVSIIEEYDVPMFQGRAFEDALYFIEVRVRDVGGSSHGVVKSAAARLDALLEQATLTPTGYGTARCVREARTRFTEVDEIDSSIRWWRRGGRYRVVMSPVSA